MTSPEAWADSVKELTIGRTRNDLPCDLVRLLPGGCVGEKLIVRVGMWDKASQGDTDSLVGVEREKGDKAGGGGGGDGGGGFSPKEESEQSREV